MLYRLNDETFEADSLEDLAVMLFKSSRARKPNQTLESWMHECAGRVEALYEVRIQYQTPEQFAQELLTLGLIQSLN